MGNEDGTARLLISSLPKLKKVNTNTEINGFRANFTAHIWIYTITPRHMSIDVRGQLKWAKNWEWEISQAAQKAVSLLSRAHFLLNLTAHPFQASYGEVSYTIGEV